MKLILRNVMEDVVTKNVASLAPTLGICTCEQCMLDIVSYSLNRLPAKYVATTEGELLSKIDFLDAQFKAKIISVIASGADVIKEHPRHNLNNSDSNNDNDTDNTNNTANTDNTNTDTQNANQ